MYPKHEDNSVLDFHLFDIMRQVGLMDLLKKYGTIVKLDLILLTTTF